LISKNKTYTRENKSNKSSGVENKSNKSSAEENYSNNYMLLNKQISNKSSNKNISLNQDPRSNQNEFNRNNSNHNLSK